MTKSLRKAYDVRKKNIYLVQERAKIGTTIKIKKYLCKSPS